MIENEIEWYKLLDDMEKSFIDSLFFLLNE
jgi:hypothetical protein